MKSILRLTYGLFIGLILTCSSLIGQDLYQKYGLKFVEPSPNSMSMLNVIQQPVNLYNGTPQIELPVLELNGRLMSLPVTLSYDASGNKVNDIASWVGLGWTLKSGGMITRIVKDIPDEDTDGYFQKKGYLENLLQYTSAQRESHIGSFETGDWDNQPDEFYVSVPGFSGKFVFDTNGNPLMMPDTDYILEPAIGPNAQHTYWKLIAPDGTQYFFGESGGTEATDETRDSFDSKDKIVKTENHNFISTWHLTRIVNNRDQDEFNFTYVSGGNTTHTDELDMVSMQIGSPGGGIGDAYMKQKLVTTITIESPKYISEISSIHGKLKFETHSSLRSDLNNGRSLQRISLQNGSSTRLKEVDFQYDYFQSGSNTSSKRLKLLSMQEVGFSPYVFDYNSLYQLPERNSSQMDAWGYHNASIADPNSPTYPSGSDRSVNADRMKASILTKITYPTGGFQEFEYEPNQFRYNGSDIVGGGLRIVSNKIHDGISSANDIITTYSYLNALGQSSGETNYKIREYEHHFNQNWPLTYTDPSTILREQYLTIVAIQGLAVASPRIVAFSRAMNPIPKNPIGYSRVTQTQSGNGSTEYLFTNFSSNPDVSSLKYRLGSLNVQNDNSYPIMPDNSRVWERGLLLEENVRDEMNRLVRRNIHTYQHGVKRNNASALGLYVKSPSIQDLDPELSSAFGLHTSESIRSQLISTEERTYDQSSWTGSYFSSKIEHEYGSHLQISKTTKTLSSGDQEIMEYQYALDYDTDTTIPGDPTTCLNEYSNCIAAGGLTPNTACTTQLETCLAGVTYPLVGHSLVIKKMQEKNMISTPIETISKVLSNGITNTYAAMFTEHFLSGSQVLAKGVFESKYFGTGFEKSRITFDGIFEKHDSYIKKVSFDSYSNEGYLKSFSRTGSKANLRYLYAHDGTLATAEIMSNSFDENDFAYTSFETAENGNWVHSGSGSYIPMTYNGEQVADAMTGKKVYLLLSVSLLTKNSLDSDKTYVVTFWAKNGQVKINGQDPDTGQTSHGWTFYRKEVTGVNSVSLTSDYAMIDELRLFPAGSTMTTYTYDPLIGITSINNPNNMIKYYEYDDQLRLKAIKDVDWNYLQLFEYAYQVDAQSTDN